MDGMCFRVDGDSTLYVFANKPLRVNVRRNKLVLLFDVDLAVYILLASSASEKNSGLVLVMVDQGVLIYERTS